MSDKIQYFTITDTCKLLHISLSTARRGLFANKSKPWTSAVRVGRRVLMPLAALSQLVPYNSSEDEAE